VGLAVEAHGQRAGEAVDRLVDLPVVMRGGDARVRRHRHLEHDEIPGALRLVDQEAQLQAADPDEIAAGGFHHALLLL
jgi:hypothetical protein